MSFIPGNTGTASSFPDGFTGSPLANVETISATKVLTTVDRRTQFLTSSVSLQIAQLPSTALVGEGWSFSCSASSAFSLRINASNGSTITTLAPGESIWLNAFTATPTDFTNWGIQIPSTVLSNGTVSTPALRFTGSGSNTGIYSPSTDAIAFSNDGIQSVLVSTTGVTTVGPTGSTGENLIVNGITSSSASHKGGGGLNPVGFIGSYNPGYYTSSSNVGFTIVGPVGNTVAQVNTFLNASGWYVCDGAAVNVVASPIWNSAGRFLPNISDSRFLLGSSTCGSQAGASSITLTSANIPSLASSGTTGAGSAHSHGVGTLVNSTSGVTGTAAAQAFTGSATNTGNPVSGSALETHTHAIQANTVFATGGTAEYTPGGARGVSGGPSGVTHVHTFTAAGSNSASSISGTAAAQTISGSTAPDSAHTHSVTVNYTNTATSFSILPTYLSTYFIVRVF